MYTVAHSTHSPTHLLSTDWGAEATFRCTKGVVGTRVGFMGGRQPAPFYENTKDHLEGQSLLFLLFHPSTHPPTYLSSHSSTHRPTYSWEGKQSAPFYRRSVSFSSLLPIYSPFHSSCYPPTHLPTHPTAIEVTYVGGDEAYERLLKVAGRTFDLVDVGPRYQRRLW